MNYPSKVDEYRQVHGIEEEDYSELVEEFELGKNYAPDGFPHLRLSYISLYSASVPVGSVFASSTILKNAQRASAAIRRTNAASNNFVFEPCATELRAG
jgi:hypothetical protein